MFFGVAWLGGSSASYGAGARLRGCVTVSPVFPSFPLAGGCAFVAGWDFPPSGCFFWGGGAACSSLCPPWACARTGRLTGSVLVSWVAAGRAPTPWLWWVMHTLGLVACAVGLGAGPAGWAVAPAGFVSSWVRGGGVILCPHAPAFPGFTFWWRSVRAGRRRRGGGLSDWPVVAPSPFMAGWSGVVPGLWARFLPFQIVGRLARVTPTISVTRFGAVVCFCGPCCVVLCAAVLRRAVLCCAAVRSALLCCAAPCHAVVCLAVAWRAAPCLATPCCVVPCHVVSWGALSWCAAQRSAVLRCAVLPRAVSCFALRWRVVTPL